MSAKDLEAYLRWRGINPVDVVPEQVAATLKCTKRQYYRELQRLTKLRVVDRHRRFNGRDIIWRSTDEDRDQHLSLGLRD